MNDKNEAEKAKNRENEVEKTIIDELEVKKIQLEKFKLAATIQDNYNTLFWTRTTVFFAINTVLFAAYGLIVTKFLELKLEAQHGIPVIIIMVILGIVGALLSVLWLQIHKRATYLQEYYRFRASIIEKTIGIEPEIFGKSYRIASTNEKWEDVYGKEQAENKKNEWDEKIRTFGVKQLDVERGKVPGGLRRKLDYVYYIFIFSWVALAILGVVVPLVCSSNTCT